MQPSQAPAAPTWSAARARRGRRPQPGDAVRRVGMNDGEPRPRAAGSPRATARRRLPDGAGERPDARARHRAEARRHARSSSAGRPRPDCASKHATAASVAVCPSRATGSATIIRHDPGQTSRQSLRGHRRRRASAANGTPKPSAKPSEREPATEQPGAMRPRAGRRRGAPALVGSPTLKTNAPRAGWVSSPTASHSTT